jgi:hypothetical protein
MCQRTDLAVLASAKVQIIGLGEKRGVLLSARNSQWDVVPARAVATDRWTSRVEWVSF